MVKQYLFFLSLFFTLLSNAQIEGDSAIAVRDTSILDTFDFDLKNFKGKGELTFVSQKSKSTGGTYQISLATGEWKYFDNDEILRILGHYKVRGAESIKTGRWEYFDLRGELLMVENFPPLKIGEVYLKPFVVKNEDGFDVINFNHLETLEKKHITLKSNNINTSTVYRIDFSNDSMNIFNYDTLVNMDDRNEDKWLLADPKAKSISNELNLVENGSFELSDGKIKNYGDQIITHVTNWRASAGTPDYYKDKKFNAADGSAAIGVRFYTEKFNHIEFLSTQLKEPLEFNKIYCLKIFVRLKEDCFYGVNALGALISDKIPEAYELISGQSKASIMHHKGSSLNYKTKWMQLSCTYTAKGNEDYLTIGSFANSDTMIKKHLKGNAVEAYYFMDNIQFYQIEKPEQCPCNIGRKAEIPIIEEPEIQPKSFVIKNIFFENDKANLLPESFISLDSLFEVIDINGFKKIEISGHTSSPGSREKNISLSKNRAEAVKKYLVKKGLPATMFICKGYGPDQPIAENDTEQGQAENRRVEFLILEGP